MRRVLTGSVLLTIAVAGAPAIQLHGQSAQTDQKPLAFEVASVKENRSGANGGRLGGPARRFSAVNMSVHRFIEWAYQTQSFQIDGGPGWINSDHFDLAATAADSGSSQPQAGGPPSLTQLRMRTLLAERFKLAVHRQTKEMSVYALVTARPDRSLGAQLRRSDVDCAAFLTALRQRRAAGSPLTAEDRSTCDSSVSPGRVIASAMPVSQLASMLSGILQRVVMDRTGLTGNYDLALTFAPDSLAQGAGLDAPAVDPNVPSLFSALQEQLGLKLESTKAPVDVLVIDHVEKPTPD